MKAKLLIDRREQNPLIFNNTENLEIVSESISFGDYGLEIDGKLVYVFERKNPGDLYQTLTKGHKRFQEEVQRAKESGIPFFVIIEESYNNIINKNFYNSFRISTYGYVLAKILHTFQLRHNVIFLFFNTREEARDYIRNTFTSFIKEHERKTKLYNKE